MATQMLPSRSSKSRRDEIAGKTVRLRVHICAALVDMQEAAVQGTDPQTAITIPQQPFRLEPGPSAWKRIRDAFPLDELPDSVLAGDQKSAVVVSFNVCEELTANSGIG